MVDHQPTSAVLFLNNGAAPNIGPGGAWLDWSRDVAREGWMALRLDLDGLGDSAPRGVPSPDFTYPPAAADDIADAMDHLRSRGVDFVTVVGLCSGALLAFDAAVRPVGLRHIIAINARFDKPYHGAEQRRVRAGDLTNRFLAFPLTKSPLLSHFERVPAFVWRVLARLHLVASPAVAIRRAVDAGVHVSLLFGPHEWGYGALRSRSPREFDQLQQHPLLDVIVIDELDHSMFHPIGRAEVEAVVRRLLHEDRESRP